MKNKILQQDIYLLVMKWADPEHLPLDGNIGPMEWSKKYQEKLEQTIAEWLTKGLVAYQFPMRRIDAFVPISHLIGTSRDFTSYVDSLVEIANDLSDIKDPQYRPHPNTAFSHEDFVLLGECFTGGIAKSAEILARRLIENKSQQEQCFQALVDALSLIQAVKPHNAGSALFTAWAVLHGKAKNRFDEISRKHPWVIEHAFALACYPICNIAAGHGVKAILDGLQVAIKRDHAPRILINDLKACRDAIAVGKQIARKNIPIVPVISPDDNLKAHNTISRRKNMQPIVSRYRYADVGGCHAQ